MGTGLSGIPAEMDSGSDPYLARLKRKVQASTRGLTQPSREEEPTVAVLAPSRNQARPAMILAKRLGCFHVPGSSVMLGQPPIHFLRC